MTRGSIPRFDLYEELEVSRLASVEVIEAAYRSLVKRHHPDVARPKDAERITRLNLAREWLRDPERRTRYDEATHSRTSTARAARARPASPAPASPRTGSRPRARSAAGSTPAAPARRSTSTSFGINTPQVRQFLSDLRELDRPRARQVWDGRAVAHSRGYSAAQRRALAASRDGRHSEWLFAREAASVIARGKLGDSTLTAQVLDVVADIAGVLTIRDLITRADFELLLLPWTWRGERLPLTPAAAQPFPKAKPQRAPAAFKPAPRPEGTPVAVATQPSAARPPTAPQPVAAQRPPAAPRPSAAPWSSAAPAPSPGAPLTWPSAAQWPIPPAPTPAPSTDPAPLAREPIALADRLARLRASAPHRRILTSLIALGRRAAANPAAVMPLLFVIVTVIAFGAAMLGVNRPQPATAGDVVTDPPATQAVAGMTSDPDPTPAATSTPAVVAIDPAQLRALQQGAQRTLRSLAAAAATGDLALARALLGDSARELRASGLRKASFPDVATGDIDVVRSGDQWIATAGLDRLVSSDGSSWTFDYADRPLAIFTGASERNLFWLAPGGRRDLYLRVTSVKAGRDGLTVRFAWEYGPGAASYLAGASIAVSSVTLGTRSMPGAIAPSVTIGTGTRVATTQVQGSVDIPSVVVIQVTVSPRTTGNGGGRPISTVFELGSS